VANKKRCPAEAIRRGSPNDLSVFFKQAARVGRFFESSIDLSCLVIGRSAVVCF